MSMTLNLETTTARNGSRVYSESKLVERPAAECTQRESDICSALYCSPVKTTSGKVARVALSTGTGALIGAAIGAPIAGIGAGPGAAIGAGVGLAIGVCTIL